MSVSKPDVPGVPSQRVRYFGKARYQAHVSVNPDIDVTRFPRLHATRPRVVVGQHLRLREDALAGVAPDLGEFGREQDVERSAIMAQESLTPLALHTPDLLPRAICVS